MLCCISPPEWLLVWLQCPGSLTKQLEELSAEACLSVESQYWHSPDWWDRYVLRCTESLVFHRIIRMQSHNRDCWFAKTVIPQTTWEAAPAFFNRLSQEHLGNLVFNNPLVSRVSLTWERINRDHMEYYWVTGEPEERWIRRSEFRFKHDFAFYLVEIMLPGLQEVTV